jgi:FMN reductase (NADPH)
VAAQTQVSESVLDTLNQHVSIRHYTDAPIPDSLLMVLLNAARRSPTSSNLQAYSFIVVRQPETKRQLAVLTGNQRHVETCPVFVAICADITRMRRAAKMHNAELAQNTEVTLIATIDAALAGMSLATAAESLGMGTVMIGGIRNKPAEVGDLLHLPKGVYPVYGLCIGYYDEERKPDQKPRFPEDVMIHFERYDMTHLTEQLDAYDAELAAHYRGEGRDTPDAAWTRPIAERFATPPRPHLRETLEAMGFSFE